MGRSSTIPRSFEPIEGVLLVLSNLAIIFPVWAGFHRNAHFEAAYFTGVGIISSLYHVCAAGFWCFAPEDVMAKWDHIFAQGGVAVLVVWVLAFDAPRYKGRLVVVQMYVWVWMFAVISLTVMTDRESIWTLVWIVSSVVLAVLFKLAVVDLFAVYWRDYQWEALVIGVLFSLSGLVLFFMGARNNYWWTHTIWHVMVFIGAGFMILGRKVKVDRRKG